MKKLYTHAAQACALAHTGTVRAVYMTVPHIRKNGPNTCTLDTDILFHGRMRTSALTYPDALNSVLQTSPLIPRKVHFGTIKWSFKRKIERIPFLFSLWRDSGARHITLHLWEFYYTADGNPDYACEVRAAVGRRSNMVFASRTRRVIVSYIENIHTITLCQTGWAWSACREIPCFSSFQKRILWLGQDAWHAAEFRSTRHIRRF